MAADVDIFVSFKYCGHSHLFNDRLISINQPVKIGRSTFRSKPGTDNLIFTCKVLSRNHAILWFEEGKLWLKDTNSSNGTFVNNVRIATDVEVKELHNGDLLQFGIDVIDADKNVNHTCIIGSLEWPIDHDMPLDRIMVPDKLVDAVTPSVRIVQQDKIEISKNELVQLSKYMKEAIQREKNLKMKLSGVVQALMTIQQCQKMNLQGSVKEDYLLARIDTLESELEIMSKNESKDAFSEQFISSQEAKYHCELQLKDSLQNNLMEKLNANKLMAEMQVKYDDLSQEVTVAKKLQEDAESKTQSFTSTITDLKDANRELANELNNLKNENEELAGKFDALTLQYEDSNRELHDAKVSLNEREKLLDDLNSKLAKNEIISSDKREDYPNNAKEMVERLIEKLQETDEDIDSYFKSIVNNFPNTVTNHVDTQTVADNKDLMEKNDRLEKEIINMVSKEETNKLIVDELECKCRVLSAEVFSKEKENDLLKTAHNSKMRTLQDQLESNKDENAKAIDTLKKSLQERSLLANQIQEENKNLRNRVDQGMQVGSLKFSIYFGIIAVLLFFIISSFSSRIT